MDRLLLKPMECAEALGLGRSTTYQLIAEGTLPSVRVGSAVRVPLAALRTWIEKKAGAAADAEARSATGATR